SPTPATRTSAAPATACRAIRRRSGSTRWRSRPAAWPPSCSRSWRWSSSSHECKRAGSVSDGRGKSRRLRFRLLARIPPRLGCSIPRHRTGRIIAACIVLTRGGTLVAESNSELVVETHKLTKIYNNRQIALNDVTLRLEPGCVLGLLGSNGAGKTTLLRLI